MARSERITCDVCGAEKSQTEKWIQLRLYDSLTAFTVYPLETAPKDSDVLDICGQSCAIKKISELIGGAK